MPGEVYAVAIYECESGFSLEDPDIRSLFCSNGAWIGKEPVCQPSSTPGGSVKIFVTVSGHAFLSRNLDLHRRRSQKVFAKV